MGKKIILFAMIISNFLLAISCAQLNETLIEELDNSIILANLIESFHDDSNPQISLLARMSNEPNSGLINSFYTKAGIKTITVDTRVYYEYHDFINILRYDSIQENDLNTFNSTFIKDNLTQIFDGPSSMFYTGDKFLFKNKYNFISFYSNKLIGFYSLTNTEGKNEIDILLKDLRLLKEKKISHMFIDYDELVYYTLSDSSSFTPKELENEGKILIPDKTDYYPNKSYHFFSFIEISIKTLEITKIIGHFQNSKEPSNEADGFLTNTRSCSLNIYRNRFASFIYIMNNVQKYLIFDLKNIEKYEPTPTEINTVNETLLNKIYYFLYKPKETTISHNKDIGYTKLFSLTELSKKNIVKSPEINEIEAKYLNLNLDLYFFNCYSFDAYFNCELMKFNIEGDSSDNSNTHLSIADNPFTLIASNQEKNYIFMNRPFSMNDNQIEIAEIRRKLDEKKNILIFKYLIVGKVYLYEEIKEEYVNPQDLLFNLNYNYFTVEFQLNNLSSAKLTLISKQKSLHFRRPNGEYLKHSFIGFYNMEKLYDTSRYLFSFPARDANYISKTIFLNVFLYVGYFDINIESECERKIYQLSAIRNKDFNIIKEIFNNIENDIKKNDFLSEDVTNNINISNIGIRFVNCMFTNTYYNNYTGLCGKNNILLKNNNENIKLNIEYYNSADKLIIKKVPDSSTDECHWHKGMYSYKYDIVKINNKGSKEILNSCKIFFDYNTNCNGTETANDEIADDDDGDNDDNDDDDNDDIRTFKVNSSKGLNNLFLLLIIIFVFWPW